MKLRGKLAVVTGAAMGMGKCISRMLLEAGCKVALVDVNAKALSATADELSDLEECRAYTCDIADRQAVYALAETIRQDMGAVSILVNNAGIVQAAPLDEWHVRAVQRVPVLDRKRQNSLLRHNLNSNLP